MTEVSIEEQNIMRFVDAVMKDNHLELIGTNADEVVDDRAYKPDELFVLRDTSVNEKTDGAFPKMEVREVMEKCTTDDRAKHIIGVLKGEENSVRLYGITRIVGYYSRTNSWNKSKVGELRDRGRGMYKLDGGMTNSQERMEAISAL